MPSIQTQRPAPRPANGKPAPPSSLLATAIPVAELDGGPIKLTIYGTNRTGKTTLACEFDKPLLLVAFEPVHSGGARSVVKVPGVKIIKIKSTRDALQLAGELERTDEYATVVVDSATSYQDIILQEIMGLDSAPEMLNWGLVSMEQYRKRSEKTREALRPFMNLAVNTVILAKERDHNPPDKEKPKILRGFQSESFFAADLGGATVGWLHDSCDYITRLYLEKEVKEKIIKTKVGAETRERREEYETGRVVRRLRTMFHPCFAAGLRSASPEVVPEYIEAVTPREMYAQLMDVIAGKRAAGGKYPAPPDKLKAGIDSRFEAKG